MTESELRTLPRKLAERMISETDNFGDCSLDIAIAKAEAVILEAIEQTLESAAQAIEERIKEVATEICKGESATASHALLTHIAIPQALAAIRSLKPAKPEEAKQ